MSMVSFLSCECSDQADVRGHHGFSIPRWPAGSVPASNSRHARLQTRVIAPERCIKLSALNKQDADGRSSPPCRNGISAQVSQTASPACFPALLAPNKDREIGGGRATRQPGQVRKEAALTRSGSGRSSVSYLFFERIAQGGGESAHCAGFRSFPQAGPERQSIADRPMSDAGAPPTSQTAPTRAASISAARRRPQSPTGCWRANTAPPVSTT